MRSISRFMIFTLTLMLVIKWVNEEPKKTYKKPVNVYSIHSNTANESLKSDDLSSIDIKNEVINLKIDKKTGSINYLSLIKYHNSAKDKSPVVLLDSKENNFVRPIIQNVRTLNFVKYNSADVQEDNSNYYVILESDHDDLIKTTYQLSKEDYKITVLNKVESGDNLYRVDYQISSEHKKSNTKIFDPRTWSFKFAQGHIGASVYTPEDRNYKKLHFDDFDKKTFAQSTLGGWISIQKELFLTTVIPASNVKSTFYTAKSDDRMSIVGLEFKDLLSVNSPKEVTIYSGPELRSTLDALSPGLSDTIDYGFLYYICIALFWFLSKVNLLIGNWGLSIIALTLCIKAITFPLSIYEAKGKKKLALVNEKLGKIKEKYKDNTDFDNEEFYNEEHKKLLLSHKINPLAVFLPSLIPAPIFMGLFWILNQSIELRLSSLFWINDLSSSDPYFILPAIFALIMIVQQMFNKTKLLSYSTLLPLVFSAGTTALPAGVLLYFITNSLVSLYIERTR